MDDLLSSSLKMARDHSSGQLYYSNAQHYILKEKMDRHDGDITYQQNGAGLYSRYEPELDSDEDEDLAAQREDLNSLQDPETLGEKPLRKKGLIGGDGFPLESKACRRSYLKENG